jgi:tight adherence protein B
MTLLDILLAFSVLLITGVVWLVMQGARLRRKRAERIARIKAGLTVNARGDTVQATLRRQQKQGRVPLLSRLAGFSFSDRLRARFEFAGLIWSVENYLLLCAGLTAGTLLFLLILGKSLLLGMLAGFVVGFGLPHFYVGLRIGKRKKHFLQLFPDGIDLIVRGLRAGLPVAKSMQTVSTEIGEPVGGVFRDLVEQVALGVNLEEALSTVARRLNLTEFNFFVTSIILQRETGGNLAEILANLSDVLRQRHIMRLKIKAMSSEARASAMIVGALPFLVTGALIVISPGYIDPLLDDLRGNIAAACASASMGFGVFIMMKLSSFEI